MVKVPVLLGFDHARPIGWLEVDAAQLPFGTDFHFAIGYRLLTTGSVELLSVSPVLDAKFAYTDGRSAAPASSPPAAPEVKPSREEVWLRIYAALAGALGANGPTARDWADKALEEFDKRFPPK